MLTRLYADNFRCLVNFELKFDRLNLLMGDNGAGKSAVFAVLRKLQSVIAGGESLKNLFTARSRSLLMDSLVQRFELNLVVAGLNLHYVLVLEHKEGGLKRCVIEESLVEEGLPLFIRLMDTVSLFNDDHTKESEFTFSPFLTAMNTVEPSNNNKKLTAFCKEVSNFVIASISPSHMKSTSQSEDSELDERMGNFVSWYRRLAQENMGAMSHLFSELRNVLSGFESFSFKDSGEDTKILKVLFDHATQKGKMTLNFAELSDGQRCLIVLYTLIHGLKGGGYSLFLDEPDNFVALREIQPWLAALEAECGQSFEQAVLISHHPEIINYLGSAGGRWLARDGVGPTRVTDKPPTTVDGLTLSETIARGWTE